MYNLFYSNISNFFGYFEGMRDEEMDKTPIQNMHKIGWKSNNFKSDDISMLGHGFGVSQFTQFYEKIKNKYQLLPRPYVGSHLGEKGHKCFKKHGFLK